MDLRSLEDLPAADELRRIVVEKPEALVTADPGLATAPPEQLSEAPKESEAPTTEGAQPQDQEKPPETTSESQPSKSS